MKSPKRKRISYVNAGVLIVDQVKPNILKGTAVRFDRLCFQFATGIRTANADITNAIELKPD